MTSEIPGIMDYWDFLEPPPVEGEWKLTDIAHGQQGAEFRGGGEEVSLSQIEYHYLGSEVHGADDLPATMADTMDYSRNYSFDTNLEMVPQPNTSFQFNKNQPTAAKVEPIRKRKGSLIESMVSMDNDLDEDDDRHSRSSLDDRRYERQNHSEIEKRRRDKMNSFITELATYVPMCNAMNRKLDKLTVLRMAVQHMKTLRGSGDILTEISHKPAFLTDDELKHLILKAADGFLFVVGCDRGKILYVSESVKNNLSYSQSELIGQSLFDFLHPKDISKVKEQLLSSDISPREKLIDAKTMLPVKTEMPQRLSRLCSGVRRAFFCRMKTGSKSKNDSPSCVKQEQDANYEVMCPKKKRSERKSYCVIHCTGYLKSWPPAKMGLEEDNEGDSDSCNLSCLVAIGKLLPPFRQQTVADGTQIKVRPMEYMSRHSVEGKFTYIDQRATTILGYLPQELLGTSMYEYCHYEDLDHLSEIHKKTLQSKEKVMSDSYRFKVKDGSFVHLKTRAFSFHNPWTKEVEYIVATNIVLPTQEVSSSNQGDASQLSSVFDDLDSSNLEELDTMSTGSHSHSVNIPGMPGGTQLGAGKLGRQIAHSILEANKNASNRIGSTTTLTAGNGAQRLEPNQDAIPGPSNSHRHDNQMPTSSQALRMHPINGHVFHQPNNPGDANVINGVTDNPMISSLMEQDGLIDSNSGDGNDESAMAVIMSLLEADAGLGGPVDFSDLPWPL